MYAKETLFFPPELNRNMIMYWGTMVTGFGIFGSPLRPYFGALSQGSCNLVPKRNRTLAEKEREREIPLKLNQILSEF